jgi:hypothetical protein
LTIEVEAYSRAKLMEGREPWETGAIKEKSRLKSLGLVLINNLGLITIFYRNDPPSLKKIDWISNLFGKHNCIIG